MSTHVRERISRPQTRRVRVIKMPLGLNAGEAVAALVGMILVFWMAVYYFVSLKPEADRLKLLEKQFAQQQQDIIANVKPPEEAGALSPSEQAKIALDSLESFKEGHLKSFSAGRIALIKEINAMAKKNSATLTSGIEIESSSEATARAAGQSKTDGQTRKKEDEIAAAFPSVNFRFTVFGQYSNLRNLISDLEHQKQFLVINAVNLSNQEARVTSRRSRSEGVSGIMLTIEMSAFFQPM